MAQGYAFQGYDGKKMARALGISLPISHKQAREVCHHLKNRSTENAKKILNEVFAMRSAIPFKRFNRDVGHKPGIAAGRYPQSTSKEVMKLIESVEANAQSKGITTPYIIHMCAHIAPAHPRGGRTPGSAKRAHVEIVVESRVEKKAERRAKKTK